MLFLSHRLQENTLIITDTGNSEHRDVDQQFSG